MKFTITPSTLRDIRPQIEAALKEVAKQNGITLSLGTCRYLPDQATFKLHLIPKAGNGKAISPEEANFNRSYALFHLKKNDLGREFHYNGKTFTLTGLNPKRHKYPVCATNQSGSRFKLPDLPVAAALHPEDKSLQKLAASERYW